VPVAIGLFAVITIVSTGSIKGLSDLTADVLGSRSESPAKIAPATATMGKSIRDGSFAFVVTAIQPPSKTLRGRSGTTEAAQGAFVIVRVDVTNIGYDPVALTATSQYLVSDKGKRFATSSVISSLRGTERIFLDKINPGHTAKAAPILFDVPAGTTIASIELHASGSSTGVNVKLT